MKHYPRALLLILDGWGHGKIPKADAIQQANTPFIDSLHKNFPNSELVTYGEAVGLPDGQMGNSEVGHLNIGAGRIVYQELARINKAIREKTLQENPVLKQLIAYSKNNKKPLHLMGLVSDGGVHSHINHLKALCDICVEAGLEEVYIHAFTDGRDTAPESGKGFVSEILNYIKNTPVELASVCGRYYAMDRDKRWERIQLAYDALVNGRGTPTNDFIRTIQAAYHENITDEFLKPMIGMKGEQPVATIQEGDAVLCFNFRTDRCRQITTVLTQEDMPNFNMQTIPLHYTTMTRYDDSFKDVNVVFEKNNIQNTLGEVLAHAGKTQLRMAETEKYPHVTFFFSGGREEAFEGESRIVVPSPKVATYDLQPEMSALEVTEKALEQIQNHTPDFICLNFANTDMVGHTGDFEAGKKAAECVDNCTRQLVEAALEKNYGILIIADHGNSDFMINEDGTPHTAHTTNPVPCIFVAKDTQGLNVSNGKLADVAPTILFLLGLAAPEDMDGMNLLV